MKKHIEILMGVAWGGKDLVPGDTVELSESDANMLIHANKAKEVVQETAPAPLPKSAEVVEVVEKAKEEKPAGKRGRPAKKKK